MSERVKRRILRFIVTHKASLLIVMLCFFVAILLVPRVLETLTFASTDYPDGKRIPTLIAHDFILTHRFFTPPHEPTDQPGFRMVNHETLVIRDCIIYTSQTYAPDALQRYEYGADTDMIYLLDYANLTLINVTFLPDAYISVRSQASLRVVNCTNFSHSWGSEEGGQISVREEAMVWIEASQIGFLTIDYGQSPNLTVIDSYVYSAKIIPILVPPQFIDCEIYELYDTEGTALLLGTTTVKYPHYG